MAEEKVNEIEHVEVAAIEPTAIEAMERATVDIQIITAHKFPRSLSGFMKRASDMVAFDEETAQSCIYRRPVGSVNGKITYAEGESIRLAEIVAASYGNIRAGAMITEMTPTYVKAVGFAHDLESNYAVKAEVVESTVRRDGQPYDARMRVVVAKAAQSKAIRDAIFRVIPKSLCKPLVQLARDVAFGKTKMTMEQRRKNLLEWVSKLGVGTDRVYDALGVKGIEDVGVEQLEILAGLKTAIKDGDITTDEAFPPIANGTVGQGVAAIKSRLSKKKEERDPETVAKAEAAKKALSEAPPVAEPVHDAPTSASPPPGAGTTPGPDKSTPKKGKKHKKTELFT